MTKIYNWGIMATGGIAHKFATDLVDHVPNARVHAVASRSLDKAQAFAAQYGAPIAVGSYKELLSVENLDIVYIASPHSEHYANALMCLEARIPVLCEKPFTVNATQLHKLVQVARAQKVFLQEAIWTRFHPAVQLVQDEIAKGTIGEIVHLSADFGYAASPDPLARWFNPALTGGSLMDIGIYPLFIAKLLLGNPAKIQSVGVLTDQGVDMNTSMALSYASGATASLFSTFKTNTATTCHIFGTKGNILMHGRFHETKALSIALETGEQHTYATERLGYGYSYEAVDAQRCLAEGKTENDKLDLNFSLELMAILDTVRGQIGVVYPEDNVPS